MDTLLNKR